MTRIEANQLTRRIHSFFPTMMDVTLAVFLAERLEHYSARPARAAVDVYLAKHSSLILADLFDFLVIADEPIGMSDQRLIEFIGRESDEEYVAIAADELIRRLKRAGARPMLGVERSNVECSMFAPLPERSPS